VKYSDKPEVVSLSLNNLQGPIYLYGLVVAFAMLILIFENVFRLKAKKSPSRALTTSDKEWGSHISRRKNNGW
jgi:hypothetical protein